MYEFGYRAAMHKGSRPSFVKADHGDDVGFVYGGCFWSGIVKMIGMLHIIYDLEFIKYYNVGMPKSGP